VLATLHSLLMDSLSSGQWSDSLPPAALAPSGAPDPGPAADRPTRVHILGASGSGTTTLGRALAERLGCPLLDADDYFWVPTDPPFQQIRVREERQALLRADVPPDQSWVLSGSLCDWGDIFIPLFDLVVFLWIPPAVRLARLAAHERPHRRRTPYDATPAHLVDSPSSR
jgi:hypothetical protein